MAVSLTCTAVSTAVVQARVYACTTRSDRSAHMRPPLRAGTGGNFGGGIESSNATLTVTQSTFSRNTANFGTGGGIDLLGGTATVDSSTFAGNSALTGGGGIWNGGGALTVTNSTFNANT